MRERRSDVWYRRSEFWLAIAAVLQMPAVQMIPGVGQWAQIASGLLAVIVPTVYVKSRGDIKTLRAATLSLPPPLPK